MGFKMFQLSVSRALIEVGCCEVRSLGGDTCAQRGSWPGLHRSHGTTLSPLWALPRFEEGAQLNAFQRLKSLK